MPVHTVTRYRLVNDLIEAEENALRTGTRALPLPVPSAATFIANVGPAHFADAPPRIKGDGFDWVWFVPDVLGHWEITADFPKEVYMRNYRTTITYKVYKRVADCDIDQVIIGRATAEPRRVFADRLMMSIGGMGAWASENNDDTLIVHSTLMTIFITDKHVIIQRAACSTGLFKRVVEVTQWLTGEINVHP